MKKHKLYHWIALSILLAVEILLFLTPLGYIRLGIFNITTLHIPVLLAALSLGTKASIAVGLLFGFISVWNATFFPNLTSFVFSPFIEVGGIQGNGYSLMIAFLPRILLGVTCAWSYQLLSKYLHGTKLRILIATAIGSLTHTFLVLILIYIFFANAYANAIQIPHNTLLASFLGILFTNGIAEVVLACIISLYTCPLLSRIKK